MIKIEFNNKEYNIEKAKLIYVLERLSDRKISDDEIFDLMKKYYLFDESFLSKVNDL